MSSLTRAVCRVSPHFPLWAVGPRPVRSPCACYSTGTGENAEKGVLAERPEEQTELAERSAPVPEWVQKLQDLKVKLADAPEDKGDIWLAEVPPKPKPVPLIVRARMQREKERLLMEAEEAGELANVDPGVLGPARTKIFKAANQESKLHMARELSYFGRFKKKEGWESKALRFVFVMIGTAIIIYVFMSDEEDDLPPEYATATVEVRERARERIEKAKIIRTID
uniref:Uncharacterized protein n=1 Tax=Eutreptiella gymnastica TaxID=73025 RepID=A0A7S4GI66_9EUGL